MTKPTLDLYPPVTMPTGIPTWEDIERLALYFPTVHHAVTLHRRGDLTREQALASAVFALADGFQKLFAAEVERRMMTIPDRIVFPGEPGRAQEE